MATLVLNALIKAGVPPRYFSSSSTMSRNLGRAAWWLAINNRNACSMRQAVFWETPSQWARYAEETPLLECTSEYMA